MLKLNKCFFQVLIKVLKNSHRKKNCHLDCPYNYTFDQIGKKRIKAATTVNEKTQLSAAFTVAADGYKLWPYFALNPTIQNKLLI